MTNYRRNLVPGGRFFFTVNLAERRRRLLTDHVNFLRKAFRHVRKCHPFTIQAAVVLPDHLHMIWMLPENDSDYALRWRLIKAAFSRGLAGGERVSMSRIGKGERGIWQRRYWEHTLRDDADVERHLRRAKMMGFALRSTHPTASMCPVRSPLHRRACLVDTLPVAARRPSLRESQSVH